MRKIAILAALCIAPASFALNNRSAVSRNGLDTNPCTVASPCRSFSTALTNTIAGGEIVALDSGGYGSFTIDRALTVSGAPGVHAAITTANNGITVNTAGVVNITIRNLVLIGPPPTSSFFNGILVLTASEVRVIGCLIRGFEGPAVQTHRGNISVDQSTIVDNGSGVVALNNSPGSGTVRATVTNSDIQGNEIGVYAGSDTAVVLRGTAITHGIDAVEVISGTGTGFTASVVLEKSVVAHNQGTGLTTSASGANNSSVAYLSDTLFENDNQPFVNVAGGVVYTFGNNEFLNNQFPPDPLTPIAMK